MATKQDNTTKAVISVIILVMGIFGSRPHTSSDNVTDDNLDTIISEANQAFDLAEKNILKVKPDNPDDNIECSCNGTGVIVHGDGHETPCPCENCDCEAPTAPPEECDGVIIRRGGFLRRLLGR